MENSEEPETTFHSLLYDTLMSSLGRDIDLDEQTEFADRVASVLKDDFYIRSNVYKHQSFETIANFLIPNFFLFYFDFQAPARLKAGEFSYNLTKLPLLHRPTKNPSRIENLRATLDGLLAGICEEKVCLRFSIEKDAIILVATKGNIETTI